MDRLIEKARQGDRAAFADVTRRYQNMALAYAASRLGDFHLAQDAVQETFISVYFSLPSLADTDAFAAWLRGIIRHQCGRLMRRPGYSEVAIADTPALVSADGDPALLVERRETANAVLATVMALPDEQREAVMLYYLEGHSQREVADFLSVPIATVNNRLHAARAKLKRRMVSMVTDTLNQKKLSDDFAKQIGEIVKVRGPIVDVHLAAEELPEALDTLRIITETGPELQIAQRLGKGKFRCVPVAPRGKDAELPAKLSAGFGIAATDNDLSLELSENDLSKVVSAVSKERAARGGIIETGIKVIDLFCPVVAGGMIGLFGVQGVGKAVVAGELLRRLGANSEGFTIFGLTTPVERPLSQEMLRTDTELLGLVDKTGKIDLVWLISSLATDLEYAKATDAFDTVLYCSPELALQDIWPALDPLICHSGAVTPDVVGEEHCAVYRRCIEALTTAREIMTDPLFLRYLAHRSRKLARDRAIEFRTVRLGELSETERRLVARARKIELFMSQPFLVAEPYTKRPGATVPRTDTIAVCRDILDGKYDHLPEESFRFVGGVDEVLAKARS